MYDLSNGKQRRTGLGIRGGPANALLSTFRGPSIDPESQVANSNKGGPPESGWSPAEEDEISSSKAPFVLTEPRIRRRTPAPETSHDGGMDDHDGPDTDNFAAPVQTRSRSKAVACLREDGDIIPTTWKSTTTKERDEETQRLLKKTNSARVNPQHISGARFDVDSVRQIPGPSWDKGPKGKNKSKTTYRKKPVIQSHSRTKTQTTFLGTDDESEDKDELQSGALKLSVTHTKKEFKNPQERFPLPAKKEVQPRPFRDPTLMHPLPPKDIGSQSGNDPTDTNLLKPQPKGFRFPTETYKVHKNESELTVRAEKQKVKDFVNPFAIKYNPPPEAERPESQSQAYYVDDSDDEIASIERGSDPGGSKKRKASSAYPGTGAINLCTPKVSYVENRLSSSPNGVEHSIGGSQTSTMESRFPSSSSQVRRMDDIGLKLRETKLCEQGKKRKKGFETADVCVLCATVLPLGTLDTWKDDDGELRPIRMAEWTEICNSHKAADLQKEWEEKGYPVIEWKGLKKRVEKHHQFLVDIVENKVLSPFREVFAKQQKEIRGNAALLLRKDHQLQYPGYYGPRGSGILLHEITVRLASLVGDVGKKDGLIAQGGVAAFIQTVLVPELGVRLIMEDMDVEEAGARIILDESREIGEKLNMDEFTEDIYDEEDGPWFDINAKTPEVTKKKGLLDAWHDDDVDVD